MAEQTINSCEEALLKAVNAARTARQTLDELIADSGMEPDEEAMEAVERGKTDEEACMAYLEANAPKCPGCNEAFAFQRQDKKPNRCSWCGYDHDTGEHAGLVPA